jgi:hypothetical protein
MPNVADAPVALVGQVMTVQAVRDYETKLISGQKVLIMVANDGEVGFAEVKFTTEELVQYDIQLAVLTTVAWWVRSAPWKMDGGNSGMSTRFVRTVNGGDIDRFASLLQNSEAKR